MNYPFAPQNYIELIKLILKFYGQIFVKIVLLIALVALLKWSILALSPLPLKLHILIEVFLYFFILFLLLLSLYRTHMIWLNQTVTLKEEISHVLKHLLQIISVIILIALALTLLIVLFKWLFFSLLHLNPTITALLTMIGVGLPIILLFLFTFFTVPLLLTQRLSIGQAFRKSALLTSANWFFVFILYAILVFLITFLLPTSKHALWLANHHLTVISDWVVLSIALPIFFSLLLLLMNDLNLRVKNRPIKKLNIQ